MTVAAGFAVLVAVWLLVSPRTPPLFDGVGFPDEPYRYVSAPAGMQATKPVTSASAQITVVGGTSRSGNVATGEQGPQAAVYLNEGAIVTSGKPSTVQLDVVPVVATPAPTDGTAPGNAYRISATGGSGAPHLSGETNTSTVLLRIPKATSRQVAIEILAPGGWQQLTTFRTGTDVYSANLPAFGEVAAVIVTRPEASVLYAGATRSHSGGGVAAGPLLAGGIGLGLIALVLGVRVVRRRQSDDTAG